PGTAVAVVFTATADPGVASLAAAAGGNQAAMAGTAVPVAPAVLVRDSSGAPMPGIAVRFAVTAGGGNVPEAVVTTNASGVAAVTRWTLGSAAVLNTLTASVEGASAPPVVFRGAGCTGSGPAFEITLCITTPMTPSQLQVFSVSAARWASIIRGDIADVSLTISENSCGAGSPSASMRYDDLLIFAAVSDIDGPGSVLGQAGPCFLRSTARGLPVIGVMEFDAADMASLEAEGQLGSVILHEMGHVLGIGTVWSRFGLLQSPSTNGSRLDTYFSGTNAIAGFDAIGGSTYTGGQKVPVENTGGAGTMNAHWRESVLRNELMTGYLNAGSNPLSVLTVRSLTDLGYVVDVAAADAFSLALSLRAPGPAKPPRRLHNDLYTGPLYVVGRAGNHVRIR
ncbi:MAG TPA: leishmanolysin-related zinc metalloendopeptidase, partial [Longimicrobium sp.]|nr:leishmanolysin-related zinc metalloendopeptidase [Longimicrobium sp.]